jgi:hypothetical protein
MDPFTVTFEDCRPFIHHIVRTFAARYKMVAEVDELEGLALSIGFMKAWESYNPKKGTSFTTWLHIALTQLLIQEWRRYVYRNAVLRRSDYDVSQDFNPRFATKKEPTSTIIDRLPNLSPDARYILQLILDPQSPLHSLIALRRSAERRKQETPALVLSSVAEFLTDLDWSHSRIQLSLSQIKVSLNALV